ncbi:hypothetical protein Tco_0379686 [Tanacetum coccineum]
MGTIHPMQKEHLLVVEISYWRIDSESISEDISSTGVVLYALGDQEFQKNDGLRNIARITKNVGYNNAMEAFDQLDVAYNLDTKLLLFKEIRALGQQEYATTMAAWTSEISSFKKFATSLQKLLNAQEDVRLRIGYNRNYLQLSTKGSNAELVIASVSYIRYRRSLTCVSVKNGDDLCFIRRTVQPRNSPAQIEMIVNVHKRQKEKDEWRDLKEEKVAFDICANIKEKVE